MVIEANLSVRTDRFALAPAVLVLVKVRVSSPSVLPVISRVLVVPAAEIVILPVESIC